MKELKMFVLTMIIGLMAGNVMAQDEISDLDLRKYAVLTQSIEYMKKDISIELNKMIKAQEGMTGQRYKELAATKGDDAKLAAIDAKDYEKQFLTLVDKLKADRIDTIKKVNSDLATKMVGEKGKVYKKIKTDLKSDEALKARYETILAQVSGK